MLLCILRSVNGTVNPATQLEVSPAGFFGGFVKARRAACRIPLSGPCVVMPLLHCCLSDASVMKQHSTWLDQSWAWVHGLSSPSMVLLLTARPLCSAFALRHRPKMFLALSREADTCRQTDNTLCCGTTQTTCQMMLVFSVVLPNCSHTMILSCCPS